MLVRGVFEHSVKGTPPKEYADFARDFLRRYKIEMDDHKITVRMPFMLDWKDFLTLNTALYDMEWDLKPVSIKSLAEAIEKRLDNKNEDRVRVFVIPFKGRKRRSFAVLFRVVVNNDSDREFYRSKFRGVVEEAEDYFRSDTVIKKNASFPEGRGWGYFGLILKDNKHYLTNDRIIDFLSRLQRNVFSEDLYVAFPFDDVYCVNAGKELCTGIKVYATIAKHLRDSGSILLFVGKRPFLFSEGERPHEFMDFIGRGIKDSKGKLFWITPFLATVKDKGYKVLQIDRGSTHFFTRRPYFLGKALYIHPKEFWGIARHYLREAGTPVFGVVEKVMRPSVEEMFHLSGFTGASFELFKDSHGDVKLSSSGAYNPFRHKVVFNAKRKVSSVHFHEFAHALDNIINRDSILKAMSSKLIPPVKEDIRHMLVDLGYSTDEKHYREDYELFAQVLEIYMLFPDYVKRRWSKIYRRVIRPVEKQFPEFFKVARHLDWKRFIKALKGVNRSPIFGRNVPSEVMSILTKRVDKLTAEEREFLRRLALTRRGRKFLRDVYRRNKRVPRYLYSWLINPSRYDIPDVDTPNVGSEARRFIEHKERLLRRV